MVLQRVGLYAMASYYGVIVGIRMLKLLFTLGPRAVLAKPKYERPAVLSDPTLGTHGYLHLEHVRLHYVASGPEDKPLMLFLHGFPEFWFSWRHQIREFQRDYRVVAIDQRGYGDSDKPAGVSSYAVPLLLADVKQVITALGYKSCILVAHDWGGGIAWAFARHFPDMVDKLVVMNAPPAPVMTKLLKETKEQRQMSWYMFFFQLPYFPELVIRSCNYAFFDRVFGVDRPSPIGMMSNPLQAGIKQSEMDAYKFTFSQPGVLTSTINWYRAALRGGRAAYDMQYPMPVLFIWGLKDVALSSKMPDLAKQMWPSLTVKKIPEAGHFVQMDTPELVNKAMREWLAEQKDE